MFMLTIKQTQFILPMIYSFIYRTNQFCCFVLYFPFPTHRLYIILCHPELFLAETSTFGVTKITYTSLSLTTVTFLLLYIFSFSYVTIRISVHIHYFFKIRFIATFYFFSPPYAPTP
jgi:hypothetical protein